MRLRTILTPSPRPPEAGKSSGSDNSIAAKPGPTPRALGDSRLCGLFPPFERQGFTESRTTLTPVQKLQEICRIPHQEEAKLT